MNLVEQSNRQVCLRRSTLHRSIAASSAEPRHRVGPAGILSTARPDFDPLTFRDRYEEALLAH
jgi:hypothetical protein